MTRAFLTAEWRHIAMLNYEVDPAVLIPHLPKGTELDTPGGRHFVSLVGFLFLDTHVLGLPALFHQNFEEVNLRFYVRRIVGKESLSGVVFLREMVPLTLVSEVATVADGVVVSGVAGWSLGSLVTHGKLNSSSVSTGRRYTWPVTFTSSSACC